MVTNQQAIDYHTGTGYGGRPGKIGTLLTKPCETQEELSLAYTPGVAVPVLAIARDRNKPNKEVYNYTSKGNLVAIVTNGTAILGLGDLGAIASIPVMEGKIALFKSFGHVDGNVVALDTHDPNEIIKAVKLQQSVYGGINLEDIKAPECFYIEERLKQELDIPVFHDDQHGTAVISLAGLYNAAEITDRWIKDMKVVFSGAGAAGISCAKLYRKAGVQNLIMVDSAGVIYKGRENNMNPYKEEFAVETDARTLEDAIRGADVFVGVSPIPNSVSPEMILSMADYPIIFAMANPDPEIRPERVASAMGDKPYIMATGRSDYPNQINNVLGFPFIFRGALDARASDINDEMKMAAAHALATQRLSRLMFRLFFFGYILLQNWLSLSLVV
jgi:malate dehydrogenase (oxaloacetate-decarboxylating)(NADP+)